MGEGRQADPRQLRHQRRPQGHCPRQAVNITQGRKCTQAAQNGLCETWQNFTPVKLCFWYYNTPGSGGNWLLNTAYPSLNANCS
ncbi:hypothetical protein [Chromobacterium sphagni]|uniref:hypothetical protein n=1 Tax=Chromobacterium sphagni TaxID=1903179 RepID=UPI0011143CDE|nr:hypothetical protein [Chromobacterium sphagni]